MKAGQLDQRVTLQALQKTGFDALGQPVSTVQDVCTCWAAVEPLAGREYIAAGAMQAEVQTRIRMRYRPGIDSTMRVLHGLDTYEISAVIHIKSAKQEIHLMCKRLG